MYTGIAGGLLVFTGIWHATEWMMDGRRRDTWALVPVGLVYLALGYMVATSIGGAATQIIALIAVTAGGTIAFKRRDQFEIRKWVTWSFILIDMLIALSLILGLLG
ncbi:hypothetical protein TRP8649_00158 [Pelagimonas phthalicica]|uniref:Uncharacterized protein n=1 Tax=Pelagimonas phthalicica TaxID=1037362 RepID=A0A238J6T5_9RHOB|nr:hypothetical protein [Pelagimonas phthalicica]TDS95391.1 hypothetical protein CLV87_1914 [Pelagimonas phthalicica]SMX26085.1 hypothetical protein TRP8649_00158 [Pelagimonas phthalicica]